MDFLSVTFEGEDCAHLGGDDEMHRRGRILLQAVEIGVGDCHQFIGEFHEPSWMREIAGAYQPQALEESKTRDFSHSYFRACCSAKPAVDM